MSVIVSRGYTLDTNGILNGILVKARIEAAQSAPQPNDFVGESYLRISFTFKPKADEYSDLEQFFGEKAFCHYEGIFLDDGAPRLGRGHPYITRLEVWGDPADADVYGSLEFAEAPEFL